MSDRPLSVNTVPSKSTCVPFGQSSAARTTRWQKPPSLACPAARRSRSRPNHGAGDGNGFLVTEADWQTTHNCWAGGKNGKAIAAKSVRWKPSHSHTPLFASKVHSVLLLDGWMELEKRGMGKHGMGKKRQCKRLHVHYGMFVGVGACRPSAEFL